jgi:hypothetical protein
MALTIQTLRFYSCARSLRGNVFTEPLPSNEFFRLSGVMSDYTGSERLNRCQFEEFLGDMGSENRDIEK